MRKGRNKNKEGRQKREERRKKSKEGRKEERKVRKGERKARKEGRKRSYGLSTAARVLHLLQCKKERRCKDKEQEERHKRKVGRQRAAEGKSKRKEREKAELLRRYREQKGPREERGNVRTLALAASLPEAKNKSRFAAAASGRPKTGQERKTTPRSAATPAAASADPGDTCAAVPHHSPAVCPRRPP